jgi:hypothetical protein
MTTISFTAASMHMCFKSSITTAAQTKPSRKCLSSSAFSASLLLSSLSSRTDVRLVPLNILRSIIFLPACFLGACILLSIALTLRSSCSRSCRACSHVIHIVKQMYSSTVVDSTVSANRQALIIQSCCLRSTHVYTQAHMNTSSLHRQYH